MAKETAEGPQGPVGPQDWYNCKGPEPRTNSVCFDIISFSAEFEMNGIPTAVVSLVLGRRGDDVSQAAAIHQYIDDLKLQLRCRVYCQAMDAAGDDTLGDCNAWPKDPFIVFEGYATGSGFHRSGSGAELTLSLTHWLTDLNFSSAISRQSHPMNPSEVYLPGNYMLGLYNTSGARAIPSHIATTFFSDSIITQDFWGGTSAEQGEDHIEGGLKDWLLWMTDQDRLNSDQILSLVQATEPYLGDKNWEACRALVRFEPNAKGPDFDETEEGYVLGVPLCFTDCGSISANVASGVAYCIGQEALEAYTNVTLWDKLAGQLNADFDFTVIPLVRKALIVPYIGGLSDSEDKLVHRTLWCLNYESVDLSATMPRPLRAIGMIIGKNFMSGGGTTPDNHALYSSFGGWFDKFTETDDERFKEGLIMFKEGPRWLSNIVANHWYTENSTACGDDCTLKTSASESDGCDGPEDVLPPDEILEQAADIWDLYAQVKYMQEVLKGRQGVITGPLRFDIAPGSTLKVEVAQDRFVRDLLNKAKYISRPKGIFDCDDEDYTFYYCAVMHVSLSIDCQNNKAFTAFYVSNIRSETENETPGTSIDRHPLWQKYQWAGCTLIQDEAFAPMVTKKES